VTEKQKAAWANPSEKVLEGRKKMAKKKRGVPLMKKRGVANPALQKYGGVQLDPNDPKPLAEDFPDYKAFRKTYKAWDKRERRRREKL